MKLPARPRSARPLARVPGDPARDWCRIVAHTDAPAEVWIYDEIGYWGTSAADFCRALAELQAEEITVRINSPGGEVWDGLAILNALRDHPARITCKIDGIAASAASFISQAGDRVVMGRQSQMMIHDASGFCLGNAADMGEMAAVLDSLSDIIASVYDDRAGGGVKSWRKAMQAETWYSADEAVTAGLADEVGALPAKDEAAALRAVAQWDLSVFRHAGRAAAPEPQIIPEDMLRRHGRGAVVAVAVPESPVTAADPGTGPGEVVPIPPPVPPAPPPPTATEPELPPPAPSLAEVPVPEPVEADPVQEWTLAPAQFQDAVSAATRVAYDPGQFADWMSAAAGNIPAPSPAPRPAFPLTYEPAAVAPAPEPEGPPPLFDQAVFRAALTLAANDVPAPAPQQQAPPPEPGPTAPIDRSEFERAIREARP